VRARGAGSDFGRPCPEGMARMGLDPARVLLAEAREARDRLWAAEEAVRAGADVLLETAGIAAYGLVASRRLLLAAQSQGRRVLALRPRDAHAPTAAVCRWRVSALPVVPAPWRGAGGLKGLTAPRLRGELVRARGTAPAVLELEWRNGAFRVAEPALLAHSEAWSEGPARIAG
jgi:protein ImuA